MKRKQCMAAILAGVMLVANVFVFSNSASAAPEVTVIIDNNLLEIAPGDATPQVINDRTMIPVRTFGEALGAEVNWNEIEQKVTITFGVNYAVLSIGSSTMTYGRLKYDEFGSPAVDTFEVLELDSPPVIVKDKSLFPLSAITTAFGVEYKWIDAIKTVMVTSKVPETIPLPTPQPTTEPVATPTPAPTGPAHSAFADTAYFQETSGRRIEDMHTGKQKFAVVLYDGTDSESIYQVPEIKDAAADATYKIYGVDMTSERFTSATMLQWPWAIEGVSTGTYPILIYSYEGQFDEAFQGSALPAQSEMTSKFKNIAKDFPKVPSKESPTPEPTSTPTATSTPSPTGSDPASNSYSWNSISLSDANEKYNRGDRFFYVVFNSSDSEKGFYEDAVEMIKETGADVGIPIYFTDTKDTVIPEGNWTEAYTNAAFVPNPSIFVSTGAYKGVLYITYVKADEHSGQVDTYMEQVKTGFY